MSEARAEEDKSLRQYDFSLQSGSLGAALADFSAQTGVVLNYTSEQVRKLRTNGLHGRHTASEGLRLLLDDTGLRAVEGEHGVVQLSSQAGAPEDATALPGVRVLGQSMETRDISMESVRRNMSKDMADVFKNDSSVVVGGGARNAQRLYVRGVESTNLNITIDGAKQGGSLHQHFGDIGSIDPSLLKRVAVQTGSSADAGPGALGGSIRFETVDAQDLLEPGKNLGATLAGQYGSVDNSWLGRASAYARFGDAYGILAHFSGADRRDYRAGGGDIVENTAGDDYDYFLKFSMLEQAGHSLRLSVDHKRDSGDYIWGGAGSDMGYSGTADPAYIDSERTSYVADYRFKPGNKLIDSKVNLYYNSDSVDNVDSDAKYTSDTFGGDVRNTFRFDMAEIKNALTAGVDSVIEERKSHVSGEKTDDGSHNIGVYLQNRMGYGPARLSFGARLDNYDAEYGSNSYSGSRVSPNVGLEFDIIPELTAFGSYGEAVRATGILPGSWMANINSNTKFDIDSPEVSKRYEAGLRFSKNGLFLDNDDLLLEGTYFDSHLQNVITAVGGRGGVVKEILNSDPLNSKGWEARLGWGFDQYHTTLGYTHVTTRDEDGEPVSITRRLAAASGDRMIWDNRFNFLEAWTFGYTLTYVARLSDVPDGEEERPGYVLHAVQAEWQPDFVPGLTLSLAINNLFDRDYSEQTSIADSNGYVREEPGQDIRLGVSYSF